MGQAMVVCVSGGICYGVRVTQGIHSHTHLHTLIRDGVGMCLLEKGIYYDVTVSQGAGQGEQDKGGSSV